MNGLYDHYGVYESSKSIYEYAAESGDFGDVRVRATTLKKFLGGVKKYFVLEFLERYGQPGKVRVELSENPHGVNRTASEYMRIPGLSPEVRWCFFLVPLTFSFA